MTKKTFLDELLGDLSKASAGKQIILGTASGWLTGFVTMKVGKITAVAVGGGILLLQIAHHKGYVKINWNKIHSSADNLKEKLKKEVGANDPKAMDKIIKYVNKELDKADEFMETTARKGRRWYHSLVNNNGHGGYQLQELHLFLASFAAGLSFGFASA